MSYLFTTYADVFHIKVCLGTVFESFLYVLTYTDTFSVARIHKQLTVPALLSEESLLSHRSIQFQNGEVM